MPIPSQKKTVFVPGWLMLTITLIAVAVITQQVAHERALAIADKSSIGSAGVGKRRGG